MTEDDRIALDPRIAQALGVPADATRWQLAQALADQAGLPAPHRPESTDLLVGVARKLEDGLVLNQRIVHDQTSAADGVSSAFAAYTDPASREVIWEDLGRDAGERLFEFVHDEVAPSLARAGHLRLIGWSPEAH